MCRIVSYIGPRQAVPIILSWLRIAARTRAGIAVLDLVLVVITLFLAALAIMPSALVTRFGGIVVR